jgi:hypothetical protein
MARHGKHTLSKLVKRLSAAETHWNRQWQPPSEQPSRNDVILKRRPNYVPRLSNELEESVLLTHFTKWSGDRYPKQRVEREAPQPNFAKLESNVYAQLLSERCRMDQISRGIFPRSILTAFSITLSVTNEEAASMPRQLLTPLPRVDRHASMGPKMYVHATRELLNDVGSSMAYRKILGKMEKTTKSRPLNFNASQVEWPTDMNAKLNHVLLEDVRHSLKKAAISADGVISTPRDGYFCLSWREGTVAFSDDGIVGIRSIVDNDIAEELRLVVCKSLGTDVLDTAYVFRPYGSNILISLWRIWHFRRQ